jgi:hypothetical protein
VSSGFNHYEKVIRDKDADRDIGDANSTFNTPNCASIINPSTLFDPLTAEIRTESERDFGPFLPLFFYSLFINSLKKDHVVNRLQ